MPEITSEEFVGMRRVIVRYNEIAGIVKEHDLKRSCLEDWQHGSIKTLAAEYFSMIKTVCEGN